MSKLEVIETPVGGFSIYRYVIGDQFRPCVIDSDPEAAAIKVAMESLEIDESNLAPDGFISSAAHPDKSASIEKAYREAVERISCAHWWSTDSGNAHLTEHDDEVTRELVSQSFTVNVLRVASIDSDVYVYATILTKLDEYPYSVLGSAASRLEAEALESSLSEAVQSWTASQWIAEHEGRTNAPIWDAYELQRRIDQTNEKSGVEKPTGLRDRAVSLTHLTVLSGEHYVTWIYADSPVDHSSRSLARVAISDGETITVFSQYNY